MDRSVQQRHAFVQRLVEQRGLRAQLRSGSLITGQLFVALDLFPGRAQGEDRLEPGPDGTAGGAERTSRISKQKVTGILAKLDKLPYEAIGDDLTKALVSLDQTLKSADKAVNRIDTERHARIEDDHRGSAPHDCLRRPGAQEHGRDPRRQGRPGQQELREALQEIARAAQVAPSTNGLS